MNRILTTSIVALCICASNMSAQDTENRGAFVLRVGTDDFNTVVT